MDAAGAMRGVRGYRVQASITGSRLTQIGLTINSATVFDLTLGLGRDALEVIEVGGASYLRANAAFLRRQLGAGAAILGGRWVRVPVSATRGLTKATEAFMPATLGRCLLENHGTLRVAGTATVAGQPTVVIEDAGDAPGAQPGKLYVATSGPPYPVRVTGTGHQRAGGRVDVCNDGKPSDAGAVATFSQFNRTPAVRAPANAAVPGGIQAA
jgi:hypothetical protein